MNLGKINALRTVSVGLASTGLYLLALQHQYRIEARTEDLFPLFAFIFIAFVVSLAAIKFRLHGDGSSNYEVATKFDQNNAHLLIVLVSLFPVALLFSLSFRLIGMVWTEPINVLKADMLPLVEVALHQFWAERSFPYQFFDVGGHVIYMTYPSGFWLPFSIPWFLGIDIRTLQLGALLALLHLLVAKVILTHERGRPFSTLITLVMTVIFVWTLIFSPGFADFLPQLHVAHVWLAVAMFCFFILLGWYPAAALSLGYLAIMRPYYIILFPLFALYIWRNTSARKPFALNGGLLFVPFVLFFLPFLLHDAGATLHGILVMYEQLSAILKENEPQITYGFALTPLLESAGLYSFKYVFALAGVSLSYALALKRMRTAGELFLCCALALLMFLSCSIIPWFYVFVDPMIFLLMVPVGVQNLASRSFRLPSLIVIVIAALLFIMPMVYVAVRSPIRHSVQFGEEYFSLFESIHVREGWDHPRWWPASDVDALLLSQVNRITLPTIERSARALELSFSSNSAIEDLHVEIIFNVFRLPPSPLDSNGNTVAPINPDYVYRGANRVRLLVSRNGEMLSETELQLLGLRLRGVVLTGREP